MKKSVYERLIQLARQIQGERRPGRIIHVSFILKGNKVISYGINHRTKTHPQSIGKYQNIHSELDAICKIKISGECKKYHLVNVSELASKLTILNIRLLSDSAVSMSKPCRFCQRLLYNCNFAEIWYTDFNGQLTLLSD